MSISIKKIVLKSKFLSIIALIGTNYKKGFEYKINPKKVSSSARTTTKLDIDEEIKKNNEEVELFLELIPKSKIKDSTILEIGTGANLLTSLNFLSLVAKKVITIDKFACLRNKKLQFKIYKKFVGNLSETKKNKLKNTIKINERNYSINPKQIKYLQKEILKFKTNIKFDYIVSYAVFEHINEVEKTIVKLKKLLKKNGKIISLVGNNDHGMFSIYHNQYYYMYFSDFTYDLMTNKSGRPNRYTPNMFKKICKKHNLNCNIYIKKIRNHNPFPDLKKKIVINKDYSKKDLIELHKHKEKFNEKFKRLDDVDLLTDYFVVEITKK